MPLHKLLRACMLKFDLNCSETPLKRVGINGAKVLAAGIFVTGVFRATFSYLETSKKVGFRGFFVGCTMAVIIPTTLFKQELLSILLEAKLRSK
jgi:hypothetical protein